MSDIVEIEQHWDIHYRHSAGETGSRFFRGLREKRVLGRRCPECQRVLVPPRGFCDRCFAATGEWVPVGPDGVLEAFTIVAQKFMGMPDPPYVVAYARLRDADTALVNYLRGLDLSDIPAAAKRLAVGLPVRVAFTERPEGRMTDFWFELAAP
jgi:uncharacterized OB-fold protein